MVHPLPEQTIRDFASRVETLYIVEELDPVIEEQVKSWGIPAIGKEIFTIQGEYSANMIRKTILREEIAMDSARMFRSGLRFSARAVRTEASFMYSIS